MQMFSLYKCVQHRHGDRFRKSIKSYTVIACFHCLISLESELSSNLRRFERPDVSLKRNSLRATKTTIQGRVQMVKTWHYSACAQLALLETNKTNETLTWTKLLAIDWTESIS